MRTLLVLVVLALVIYLTLQLWRSRRLARSQSRAGWRDQARQAGRPHGVLPALPQPPAELSGVAGAALLPATKALYVGTTMAGGWRERITGDAGQRATAILHLSNSGLLIDRISASPLWIPASAVRGARIDRRGLLVTWQLGGRLLDSAFRPDDERVHTDWLDALRSLRGAA